MFDYKKLYKIIEKQLANQEKLLGLLAQEKVALVKLNQDDLDKVNEAKAKVLDDVRDLEEKRIEIFLTISESLELDRAVTFQDVIDNCPATESKGKLQHLCDNLKTLTTHVKEINTNNSELIKSSLGLLASTMSIIRATPDVDLPTYNKGGNLSSGDTEDPAFAKKNNIIGEA